ncbi:hypothetical protein [Mumia sp. Pv 4-285]|uniref:hypothetical protein n=1 Tax=Mumia qirimensis TaxID=3234852 RepID=UPI00351CD482
MHVVEALARLGGVAPSRLLVSATSRKRVRTALKNSEIVRAEQGYALPTADDGKVAAVRLSGLASHQSAAAIHGWEMKSQPDRPSVIVPRGRNVAPERRAGTDVRWRPRDSIENWNDLVTDEIQTVIDCARDLPFDEALAIADSALRRHAVHADDLERAARRLATRGRGRAIRVVTHADGRAANPFESVLRAVALGVDGIAVEPQRWISDGSFRVRPDLVDPELRIVLEADSFGFHADRASLRRDCRRYVALALRDWLVLRFSWEDVMFDPDYVAECIAWAVRRHGPRRRTTRADRARYAA